MISLMLSGIWCPFYAICIVVILDLVNSRPFLFDLLPRNSHFILSGSTFRFFCVKRVNTKEEFANFNLLFCRHDPDDCSTLQGAAHPTVLNRTATFVFHLSNVSFGGHSGWYRCGCPNRVGYARLSSVCSHPSRLVVGSPPRALGMTFYWMDRSVFESAVQPTLAEIANNTGVPAELGGLVSIELKYSRAFQLSTTLRSCNCKCDSNTGYCYWGRFRQEIFNEMHSMCVQLKLCNALKWCSANSFQFDLRDTEKPNPVRRLSVSFEAHLLDISWKPPTTEMPGNQEYSYQVSLSDGRCLATNATRLSLPAKPDTGYSVTVRCRPKFFAGHWSDNSSVAGRSAEWLPCNPKAGEAFLVPPDVLVFPASDRNCKNGQIIYYRIVDLISNRSQIIDDSLLLSEAFLFVRLNLSSLFPFYNNNSSNLSLAIFAATSIGENSSLVESDQLLIGPVNGACGDSSMQPHGNRVVACLDSNFNIANLIGCKRLVFNSAMTSSSLLGGYASWLISRSVACPISGIVKSSHRYSDFNESFTLPALIFALIFSVPLFRAMILYQRAICCKQQNSILRAADSYLNYPTEPDMQLNECLHSQSSLHFVETSATLATEETVATDLTDTCVHYCSPAIVEFDGYSNRPE